MQFRPKLPDAFLIDCSLLFFTPEKPNRERCAVKRSAAEQSKNYTFELDCAVPSSNNSSTAMMMPETEESATVSLTNLQLFTVLALISTPGCDVMNKHSKYGFGFNSNKTLQ